MEYIKYFLIALFFIISWWYLMFLFNISKKLAYLEYEIVLKFSKRNNLIPSLHDVTKNYINKHKEVFNEILKLRLYSLDNSNSTFYEIIDNEVKIHKELNFIFKLINHNNKIQKNEKYLLLQDLFIDFSQEIWDKMDLYKKSVIAFNNISKFKNLTIIWIFINIPHKKEL